MIKKAHIKWDTKVADLPINFRHIILIPTQLLATRRSYSNNYNWFVAGNYIAKELVNQKSVPPKKLVTQLKDGTRKAIIKEIYKQYKKPKKDLIDFVIQYPNSLDEFIEYAKQNYPELNIDHLSST